MLFWVLSVCLIGSGCSNKDSGDKNIGDIVNEVNEFVDFTEKQKINTDKLNYSNLERIVGLMIFENELAYNKSFSGVYEIIISKEGTIIKFDGEEVEEDDALYAALSDYWPSWKENTLSANIKNPVITVKDGEVIRTSDPAEYLK